MVSFGQASGAVPPLDVTVLAQKGSLYLTRPSVFTFIKERQQLVSVFEDMLEKVTSARRRSTSSIDTHFAMPRRRIATSRRERQPAP